MSFIRNIFNKKPADSPMDGSAESTEMQKTLKSIVGEICEAAMEHTSSLVSLFFIEAGELLSKLKGRVACLIMGGFFLAVAYMLVSALAVFLLYEKFGAIWALSGVAGFNLLLGVVLLFIALKKKMGPFMPKTQQELKTDYQCLQIAIRESKNS